VTAAPHGKPSGRGFWPLRDLPVVMWLVMLLAATVLHPVVPAPRWLMIHLLLLGAVTHAIFVWSTHFTETLLHLSGPSRQRQSVRLALLNVGVITVVGGVLTSRWPVTLLGATGVVGAVAWHGLALASMRHRALPSRFAPVVRYYIAAACFLPVGAGLGAALARDPGEPWHHRLMFAHALVNVLGWMGLTVAGTVVTLWPTMLRTRLDEGAERSARRALPVLVAGVVLAAGASVAGQLQLAAVGLAVYLGGLVTLAVPLCRVTVRRPPSSYATWSVGAAGLWLTGSLLVLVLGIATSSGWPQAAHRFEAVTPLLAAAFGAQVLLGALSHLIPVALGGGPAVTRRTHASMDRGAALRVTGANAGLLVCALPVPSLVRVLSSVVVLACLAAFVPLLFLTLRVRRSGPPAGTADTAATTRPAGQTAGLAVTGLALVLVAVAGGVALDPSTVGAHADSSSTGVAPTGHTTTVAVEARHMRFSPASIAVPVGDRLVIDVTNRDEHVHDLTLETGADTGRLSADESARLDVGVVGRDLDGWCSVVGHRQQGMVLTISVTGAAGAGLGAARDHTGSGHAGTPDFMAEPGPAFEARNAALPTAPAGRVHRRTLTVREVEREVSPGVTQKLWTYNGRTPGPVLHGRVGDRFEVTLVNDAGIGHSVDFHAGALAPMRPTRTLDPGESLVYRFTATRAGIWMYHCSTMPMSAHIANGMFGAVVIEPPGLPEVDRSYVLVQSELYLGAQGGRVDVDKIDAEQPDAVVFNGYANQYDHRPLPARVGERVRVWVLDAGPNRATSFHVVGGQFDTVYAEGAYLLRRGNGGSQSLALQPAQSGFVELTFPEAGKYPFVSHVMVDAERGAHGAFRVAPGSPRSVGRPSG
jgi:nitrite reductase (NO-forming)